MTKKRTVLRVKQQTVRTQEPRLINDIINDLLNGQAPFARARRHRSGRAWTDQAGAGNACSGCTRSGQAGTESAAAGRAWTGLYPNTELDVDLKLVTQKQGRMELGEYLDGMITRDGEDHFTFVELERSGRLEVPGDVSVVGYDDIEMADFLGLTTVRQLLFESGRRSVEVLLRRIGELESPPTCVSLPVELIVRRTTAPPR